MAVVKLSKKSQLVLPAEVRRRLNIRPGDRLLVEVEGDRIVMRKAPRSEVEALERYRSNLWKGYADELALARGEWNR